ncbi:MAG: MFS transporter, partial [Desulfobacteraceae bacterium]|nr:MFS transporter [Desulfobacteraceae bacterium]
MRKKAIPLYLFSFFMIMPMTAVIPVLPMIRDELNASYSQISIFVACLGIVRIVLAFPSGSLVDRFDRKKILLLSGLLSLIGLLILSSSHTIFHLIVSRVFIGSGSIISVITVSVLIAQIAGFDRRGAMMSLINVAHHAGVIVSAALTGILAGWYNWRLPFLVIAGLLLLSMVTVAVMFNDEALDYNGS